ncbi:MAG: hypothetical protein GZ086_10565 [Gelidibacter sp.]|nr:hypothetical protein [Gelidibacter sp.]
MGTSTNLKGLVLMTAISSAIVPLNYESYDKITPTVEAIYNSAPDRAWQYNSISIGGNYVNVLENEKLEIVLNFSQDLISNSTELDIEFVEIVNDNFWNLL